MIRIIVVASSRLGHHEKDTDFGNKNWLVVSFNPFENISQIGNLPQIGVKINNRKSSARYAQYLLAHFFCNFTLFWGVRFFNQGIQGLIYSETT